MVCNDCENISLVWYEFYILLTWADTGFLNRGGEMGILGALLARLCADPRHRAPGMGVGGLECGSGM